MAFFYFVSFTFSACTEATSRHMAFFYFVSFNFSACTEGIRLVLYINSINFTSTYYLAAYKLISLFVDHVKQQIGILFFLILLS
jgi:hypothetical protein